MKILKSFAHFRHSLKPHNIHEKKEIVNAIKAPPSNNSKKHPLTEIKKAPLNKDKMKEILSARTSDYTTISDKRRILTLKREVLEEISKSNTELQLSGYDFRGVDLSNLNLSKADFGASDLRNTNMTNTNLSKADFKGADLRDANMTNTNLTNAHLSYAKLENIHWQHADLTGTVIAFDDIPYLPLSAEEQYEKLIECIPKYKSHQINKNEIAAIKQFKESLNVNNKLQKRLSKLDDKQLQILLPCLYVEAAHKLNPILAYNTKDTGYGCDNDDNIAMLQGYTRLLSTLNNTFDPNKKLSFEDKVKETLAGIEKLFTLLIGDDFIYCKDDNGRSRFIIYNKDFYKNEKPEHNIENNKLTLSSLESDIELIVLNDKLASVNGIIDYSPENKKKVMSKFASELVYAHAKNDISKIFKLTSDFQYLHLLPNANGRTSQIIRDCFAINLGKLPFSALHHMSHYIYLNKPVKKKHLNFMQRNFEKTLIAIENKKLTTDIYRKTSPEAIKELLKKSRKESAIKHDVDRFLFRKKIIN
ncbi:pentapeptide repeat-containing protein [Yersinia mollaretii]|uniref:pentapeptide repeat-containing protein n=1 Tax=Yersinia mollaretii TaxID=33060 RepID=UPI001427A189|nr:pentapeptide repeat-containing protein [Yersinia mollaretii]MDA5536642.1 pentapeptide repeat-containing protein [Yersinia mollaretii]NIL04525.1 pentapeptide repeat-containing protein [Yersinia mollaretii]